MRTTIEQKYDLTGWKSIAKFLGVSKNTAQTYALRYDLPVWQVDKCRAVKASKDELKKWAESRKIQIPQN